MTQTPRTDENVDVDETLDFDQIQTIPEEIDDDVLNKTREILFHVNNKSKAFRPEKTLSTL